MDSLKTPMDIEGSKQVIANLITARCLSSAEGEKAINHKKRRGLAPLLIMALIGVVSLGCQAHGKVSSGFTVSLTIVNSCDVKTHGTKVSSSCTHGPQPQIIELPENTEPAVAEPDPHAPVDQPNASGGETGGGSAMNASGTINFRGAILTPTLQQPTATIKGQGNKVTKIHTTQTIGGRKYRVLEVIYPK